MQITRGDLLTLLVGSGGFNFGYFLTLLNILTIPFDICKYKRDDIGCISTTNLLKGVFPTGAFFGVLLYLYLSSNLRMGSRKNNLIFSDILIICGSVLLSIHNAITFSLGLLIAGIGVGISSCVVPLYLWEANYHNFDIYKHRGCIFQISIALGILVSGISCFSGKVGEGDKFRLAATMILPEAISLIRIILICLFLPESPLYLAQLPEDSPALKSHLNNPKFIGFEYTQNWILLEKKNCLIKKDFTLVKILEHPERINLAVCVFLMIANQSSGINYYLNFKVNEGSIKLKDNDYLDSNSLNSNDTDSPLYENIYLYSNITNFFGSLVFFFILYAYSTCSIQKCFKLFGIGLCISQFLYSITAILDNNGETLYRVSWFTGFVTPVMFELYNGATVWILGPYLLSDAAFCIVVLVHWTLVMMLTLFNSIGIESGKIDGITRSYQAYFIMGMAAVSFIIWAGLSFFTDIERKRGEDDQDGIDKNNMRSLLIETSNK